MTLKSTATFKSIIERFGKGMTFHYISVPETVAKSMSDKFPFRVFCTIRNKEFPAAIVKHGLEGFVIQMGKQTLKKFSGVYSEEVDVTLKRDESEHGYEIPEEFAELLAQDEAGRAEWEKLTPGAQRSYLYYLNTGKSVDTRIKRALVILQRAREINAEKASKSKS
jgi:hypothetical protein